MIRVFISILFKQKTVLPKLVLNLRAAICALFLIMAISGVTAQEGNLYLYNYSIPIPNIDYHNVSITQGFNGYMYFANTKGVLVYDGVDWALIKTPGTPITLLSDTTNNRIYVGCTNDFGYLKINVYNQDEYISLSSGLLIDKEVSNIFTSGENIYFCTADAIYRLPISEHQGDEKFIIEAESKNPFTGYFSHNGQLYVNIQNKGIHILQNEDLIFVNGTKEFANLEIVCQDRYNNSQSLIGGNNNKLYLFDGSKLSPFNIISNDYISGSILSSCLNLSSEIIVLGTRSGGSLVINKKTRKTEHIINYQTGMADDEVLAMTLDRNGGLWICNEMAITHTDIDMPVVSFSYPGLEGYITSMIKHNGTLYVSTSEGLYYLGTVSKVEEVENLIKKEHSQTTETKNFRSIKSVTKLIKVKFKSPDGSPPVVREIPITIEVPVDSISTSTKDVFSDKSVRKNYALQSIPFIFKKVKGLDAKCKQIVPYKNKVLVSTNIGFYEADTVKAINIIKDEAIHYICQSTMHPNVFYIGTENGIRCMQKTNRWNNISAFSEITTPIYSIAEANNKVWMGSDNKVISYDIFNKSKYGNYTYFDIFNNYTEAIVVQNTNRGLTLLSGSGAFTHDDIYDSLTYIEEYSKLFSASSRIYYNQPGYTWVKNLGEMKNMSIKDSSINNEQYVKIFPKFTEIYVDPNENIWVISNNEIYEVKNIKSENTDSSFFIAIRSIQDKQNQYLPVDKLVLSYKNNAATFNMANLYYLNESSTRYTYKLEGLNNDWSEWSSSPVINFPYLPSGGYTLHIRAKNVFDQESEEISFRFKVATPFWKTWWFYLILAILISTAVFIVVRIRLQQLEKAKKILEHKIEVATSEIRQQKDELQEKNNHITASINYAQRIQQAILPVDKNIKAALPDSFVLFKPRDIVSGDFYWFFNEGENLVLIAADCTGHGVPGAFMSMIGNTLLNTIIKEKQVYDPATILLMMDKEIVKALKQDTEDSKTPDGMDITILTINKKKKIISFASANNSMYMIKPGTEEVERIRGDGFGLGGLLPLGKTKSFNSTPIEVESGTCCYIFSDGYVDQIGGPNHQKLKTGRFKKILLEIHQKDFEEQKSILDETIMDWMSTYHQIDDITLVGFKLA